MFLAYGFIFACIGGVLLSVQTYAAPPTVGARALNMTVGERVAALELWRALTVNKNGMEAGSIEEDASAFDEAPPPYDAWGEEASYLFYSHGFYGYFELGQTSIGRRVAFNMPERALDSPVMHPWANISMELTFTSPPPHQGQPPAYEVGNLLPPPYTAVQNGTLSLDPRIIPISRQKRPGWFRRVYGMIKSHFK
jgi:hypothetical protein